MSVSIPKADYSSSTLVRFYVLTYFELDIQILIRSTELYPAICFEMTENQQRKKQEKGYKIYVSATSLCITK